MGRSAGAATDAGTARSTGSAAPKARTAGPATAGQRRRRRPVESPLAALTRRRRRSIFRSARRRTFAVGATLAVGTTLALGTAFPIGPGTAACTVGRTFAILAISTRFAFAAIGPITVAPAGRRTVAFTARRAILSAGGTDAFAVAWTARASTFAVARRPVVFTFALLNASAAALAPAFQGTTPAFAGPAFGTTFTPTSAFAAFRRPTIPIAFGFGRRRLAFAIAPAALAAAFAIATAFALAAAFALTTGSTLTLGFATRPRPFRALAIPGARFASNLFAARSFLGDGQSRNRRQQRQSQRHHGRPPKSRQRLRRRCLHDHSQPFLEFSRFHGAAGHRRHADSL